MATRTFIFILTIVLLSNCKLIAGKAESKHISVCPATHDRAFAHGKKCCKYNEFDKSAKNVSPRESDSCPSKDSVDCPSGPDCEDSPPSCLNSFELEGFGLHFDGFYKTQDFKTGQILFQDAKQIYFLSDNNFQPKDKCVWWIRHIRRWYLGDCLHVGTKNGFAYIDADVPCPHPEEHRWRRAKTGQFFTDIHNYSEDRCKPSGDGTSLCGASSVQPLELSATAGVKATVREGKFRQSCNWRFHRNQWRCI